MVPHKVLDNNNLIGEHIHIIVLSFLLFLFQYNGFFVILTIVFCDTMPTLLIYTAVNVIVRIFIVIDHIMDRQN